jgi:3',5'-cyclic AMP phosphodiesterase CpdA
MPITTLMHISDLHFGPPFLSRVSEAALRIAYRLNPDAMVISGDFTQRATEEQFQQARAYIDQLPPVPKVVVPGNHDVPLYRVAERIFNPHRLYCKYIQKELNSICDLNGVRIVALNSTSPHRAISNGRIDHETLEFCEKAFQGVGDDIFKIVVTHHHLIPAPDYVHDQTMPRSRRAINRFVDLGVELVLGGHLHRAYIGNTLDIYPGENRERGVIIAQSGTTTSRRGRGREKLKNSFNLIKIGDGMFRITHYMYFDRLEEFAPVSRHTFPRPGREFVEGMLNLSDFPEEELSDVT